jgi:hypothetical protein
MASAGARERLLMEIITINNPFYKKKLLIILAMSKK